jgi:hypothetical protein
MQYYYKVFPNYDRKDVEIRQGRAAPGDLRAGERIIIRYEFGDENVSPSDVDYAVVESLELAHACRAELEALGFEVAICRNDEPEPEFNIKPRLSDLIDRLHFDRAEPVLPDRNEGFERRRDRFENSVNDLTNAARQTVRKIGSASGWSLRDVCPNLVVKPDHEGGAILIVFDEFGRTEWLIDPSGSELLFSRTPRPSTKFFVW